MCLSRSGLCAGVVLAIVFPAAGVFGQNAVRSDSELLQGEWICTATVKDGEKVTTYVGVKAQIEGENLTWHFPKRDGTYETQKNRFRIDPAQKHFDWWRPENPNRVEYRLYSVTANELRWSSHVDWKTRPLSFEKGRWQFTMQRVKNR